VPVMQMGILAVLSLVVLLICVQVFRRVTV